MVSFLLFLLLVALQNLQVVLQNLVEIESFLTMMMMMTPRLRLANFVNRLVERLVSVLVMLVAELQEAVVVELRPH